MIPGWDHDSATIRGGNFLHSYVIKDSTVIEKIPLKLDLASIVETNVKASSGSLVLNVLKL